MLISTNWIRDFTALPATPGAEIAQRITLATAEVESVHQSHAHLLQIKVARITGIRQHPGADRLKLVAFDCGDGGEREVVCGAPNVRKGLLVPYAPVGVTLPGGLKLQSKKIRGQLSEGMLCSEDELDIEGGSSQGLMELPLKTPVGKSLLEALGAEMFKRSEPDILLDIDNKSLTHRPDLWGHFGFAREFAAIWKLPLNNPFHPQWQGAMEQHFTAKPSPIRPQLDLNSAGLSYWALSVDGVTVTESPQWMQERLRACGMRPINSIVDISNYVMLELGIPNHIFDRGSIEGEVLAIRQLGTQAMFTTLDQIARPLVESDTVIADDKKSLVIAGAMGGLQSGVTDKTCNILIEVANWRAEAIRSTCTRLGLRTESSQRFEKSLDGNLCYRSLLRILQLVLEFHQGARVVGKAEYDGLDLAQTPKVVITTSPEAINNLLGTQLTSEGMVEILQSLDFSLHQSKGEFAVEVPSYRATKDVECAADIAEEVGRIVGYAHITPTPPWCAIKATSLGHARVLQRKLQDYLVLGGRCLEVMTYPLLGRALLEKCHWHQFNQELVLANALSLDHDRMRPSLLPGLLEAVALNQKHHHRFQLFELGRSYLPGADFVQECSQVAIAFFDRKSQRFSEAINQVENLLRFLAIAGEVSEPSAKFVNSLVPRNWQGCHPAQYQDIKIMGKASGAVFSLHPLMAKTFKFSGHLALAVIDLTAVEQRPHQAKHRYQPLAKYPCSTFDCTVVCDPCTPVGDIVGVLKQVKLKELVGVKIVDVFNAKGEQKSVTLRTTFFDPTQTLDGATVKAGEVAVVKSLEQAGFPLKP